MLTVFGDEPDEQFATWLLEAGADASYQQTSGERSSALHRAAASTSAACVRALLDAGASTLVNAEDASGRLPITAAAEAGKEANVELLVEAGSRVPGDALILACQNGHFDVATALVEAGADVNYRDDDIGAAALHLAASNSHLALVKLLLAKGADANVVEKRGFTPLMMAGSEGYLPVVVELLKAGADVNKVSTPESGSLTALHIAVQSRVPLVIAFFISVGADVDAVDADGKTARQLGETSDDAVGRNMANVFDSYKAMLTQENTTSVCGWCFREGDTGDVGKIKRCTRCKTIGYCSPTCQKDHWPMHKKACVAKK